MIPFQLQTRSDYEQWLQMYPHIKRIKIVEDHANSEATVFIFVGFWYWLFFGNALWRKLQPISDHYSPINCHPLIVIIT